MARLFFTRFSKVRCSTKPVCMRDSQFVLGNNWLFWNDTKKIAPNQYICCSVRCVVNGWPAFSVLPFVHSRWRHIKRPVLFAQHTLCAFDKLTLHSWVWKTQLGKSALNLMAMIMRTSSNVEELFLGLTLFFRAYIWAYSTSASPEEKPPHLGLCRKYVTPKS